MDGHRAAELLGLSGLQLGIYGVVNGRGRVGGWGLVVVPSGDFRVDLGWERALEPPFADREFEVTLQGRFAEADQPFFALRRLRIWKTSWMRLLLLRGDRAINSEAAATTIQKAGWDRKSMRCSRGLFCVSLTVVASVLAVTLFLSLPLE